MQFYFKIMIYDNYFSISPLDGRYSKELSELKHYFSEYAYMKYRIEIEVEYFIELTTIIPQLSNFPKNAIEEMRNFYKKFTVTDLIEIKNYEKIINHDVKAVELFLRDKFDFMKLETFYKEFIHFGLTSQDINNSAYPLMIKDAIKNVYIPCFLELRNILFDISKKYKDFPMLSRTHGQPATPTKLGKEFMVFVERLDKQYSKLLDYNHEAKFGGAVGNFNSHKVAFPGIDWIKFGDNFISRMGLRRQQYTTQIEHYDSLSYLFHLFSRINTILLDLCKDIWQYISMDYLITVPKNNEVGSSTMPHKVNPIDFEKAEGNLGLANAIFLHMSSKLPVSRLQRDLSDSTVIRSIGLPVGYSILSLKSIVAGLKKLSPNKVTMEMDLEKNWVVVSEAIQTILRREGVKDSYNLLKIFTRGKVITKEILKNFVKSLNISNEIKEEIFKITPYNYTGV